MADRIYRSALPMLRRDIDAGPFRLIGVGLTSLAAGRAPTPSATSSSPPAESRIAAEQAADQIRARFGHESIILGRSLR